MIAKVDRDIACDGSHGKFFVGNIRTFDASAVEGDASLLGGNGDCLDEHIVRRLTKAVIGIPSKNFREINTCSAENFS